MKIPSWYEALRKYKRLLLMGAFLFCLLLLYGWYKGTFTHASYILEADRAKSTVTERENKKDKKDKKDKSDVLSPTSDTGQGGGKQILSIRDSLSALPLRDPFVSIDMGNAPKVVENKGSSQKELRLQSVARAVYPDPMPNREGNIVPKESKSYEVVGVILGPEPLALVRSGNVTEAYGVGEGPEGHKIISITAERVVWEAGVAWKKS